ncbi:tRNA (adenosine(37)-N6)-dimethylallyltransferase MiaA [Inquilinus sp. Marseille-Q2685]|uniref:tRNA (adenosine(37)-N6)-dimethylallyltransferase MiaA n=1 Tax=Inquilinus sp. Marseille-Q2685 TaxID=2866581 RepID=UPI0027DEC754|nr:tRNA (adenosine(37)-N6)-dimethylallyltransferase MiaA [Inquilinus sp. Marseille-Q2685]
MTASDTPAVIVVGGPTASGKSALALDLAEALDGVVINADSMQVYAELAILTARPGPADLARAPHRLYGVLPAATRCSAAAWCDMALAEIGLAQKAGRRPIVVGGPGLSRRALTDGWSPTPPVPEEIRRATVELHESLGGEAFHAELMRWDPKMARRLAPGDTQRLIRAWEVMVATNRSLADWQQEAGAGPPPGMVFDWIVLAPPRDALYAACNGRFRAMVAAGALEEARALLALDLDPELPAMKAVGVPELAAHLRGETDLETAIARAQQATRNLAKRQTTWFRHQIPVAGARVQRSHVARAQYSEKIASETLSFLRNSG